MTRLTIKPLSVNEAWQGKRYKTKKYDSYRNHLLWILPKMEIPDGHLFLFVRFGFSSKASDVDNGLKPFIDALQIKYKFDDKRIRQIFAEKVIVSKGCEFVEFKIQKEISLNWLDSL